MLKLSWEIPFPKYEVSQGFCVYTLFSSAVQYGYRAVNAKLRCQTCWFIVSFLVFSLSFRHYSVDNVTTCENDWPVTG